MIKNGIQKLLRFVFRKRLFRENHALGIWYWRETLIKRSKAICDEYHISIYYRPNVVYYRELGISRRQFIFNQAVVPREKIDELDKLCRKIDYCSDKLVDMHSLGIHVADKTLLDWFLAR